VAERERDRFSKAETWTGVHVHHRRKRAKTDVQPSAWLVLRRGDMDRAERVRLAEAYGAAEARLQRAQAARDRHEVASARDELRELERVIAAVLDGEPMTHRSTRHRRGGLARGVGVVGEEVGDASTTSTPPAGRPASDEGL
jgi:hypothetical protein